MNSDKAKMYVQALDDAQTYRHGPAANSVELLRNLRFGSAEMFSALPAAAVERLVKPGDAPVESWRSAAVWDVARALDHGYQRSPEWFDSVFAEADFKTRGMAALCDRAAAADREAPLDILFGLNRGVASACGLDRLADLAGVARLAVRNTRPELVRGRGLFDSWIVPAFDKLDTFPTVRLHAAFSEHSDLFPLLDCSDEEKFMVFYDLTRASLIPGGKVTVVCVLAAQRNIPLHRALRVFAKTHDTRAAIEAWDMPDEYLKAAFPAPTEVTF